MPPLRAVSLIGNALALVMLSFLCAHPVPLAALDAPMAPRFQGDAVQHRPVLLIIIDALRQDTATDAGTMPALADLTTRPESRRLRVVQPVPTTIGALPAIVEGRAVPGNAALLDLTPRPASAGGLLEVLHGQGRAAEVGGTALWQGVYGRWLGPGRMVFGMPDRATDAAVMRWAAQRLTASDAPPLLIVHLGRLDAVAHRHGVGQRYRDTARDIDADIARLLALAHRAERTVLITSDHGVSSEGGHAGGEAAVRTVPLSAVGARLDIVDGAPQTVLASVLAAQLGIGAELDPALAASPQGGAEGAGTSAVRTGLALAFFVFVTAVAWRALVRLPVLGRQRTVASVWSAAVWICLAVAVWVSPLLAAALAACTLGVSTGWRADVASDLVGTGPMRRIGDTAWPLAVGAAVAAIEVLEVRLGNATSISILASVALLALSCVAAGQDRLMGRSNGQSQGRGNGRAKGRAKSGRPAPSAGTLVAVVLATVIAAVLGGAGLAGATLLTVLAARRLCVCADSVRLGVAGLVALTALSHLSGATASLSSLDVALAHRAAGSPAGIAGAVAVALLRLFWLPGVWMLAWCLMRARLGRVPLPLLTLRAAAQTSLSSLLVFAVLLVLGWPDEKAVFGAALGALLQEASLWIGLIGTVSLILLMSRQRTDPVT